MNPASAKQSTLIAPGSIVYARARRHVVLDVTEHETCRSVGLGPLNGDGPALTLLHPFDRIEVLPESTAPKRAGRRRVVRACAAAVRGAYGADQLRALVDARVSLLPFQLEPALAFFRGEATRLLLADEVGLGKTIQAGLILCELRARQALRRALVLTPAGLRDQWAAELRDRFALETTIIDAPTLAALQRSVPPWVNPWTLPGIVLASIDLLKRNELLPQLDHVIWDVVVVDEAHHAARGTDRQQAAAVACSRARLVVLITATPHSGDRAAFEGLCALGRVPGDPPIRIFRRSRQDARAGAMERKTRLIGIRRSAAERRLDARLRSYTERVWREAGQGSDARLAMVILRKRALSGTTSLVRSLRRRLQSLADDGDGGRRDAQLTFDFVDTMGGEVTDEDREPGRELEAPGLANRTTERALLIELLEAAEAAVDQDSKATTLGRAIATLAEPAIVFTEYRDTLDDLHGRLAGCASIVVLHGAMLPAERRHAIATFETGVARLLLTTDVAAEGLNLQKGCRWIVHHEVPWSPVRIEQRNGRVDRMGQDRRVHVWHLIARGTEEERVLARLCQLSAVAARDLGDDTVASAVFEGGALRIDEPRRVPRGPTQAAILEAQRAGTLRRLPAGGEPGVRPLSSPARRSAGCPTAVVRASLLDGRAREIAVHCVGVRGQSLADCRRAAERRLGHDAARSIAVDRRRRARLREREAAIATALVDEARIPLQPSLFDRQQAADSDYRRTERDRAISELTQPEGKRPHLVRTSLVGVFAPARRP